ncbi:hypothetical protein [Actinoalloteichus hymeniacidonis]|uniref:Uncharacterized protein n=1 Tax=Actinoalloteichus hymeniacidonis TaxID=340345 RepID=A0AAC9MWI6_9PSEU|nr:hypothetical protein [Actinoalloteichus hymeniacidonis]AOS60887.1 hypothetical protein TL08_00190 [Actinoalloteichus hymeniacidonis]MBB5911113.1 hypothetical protein [Actinoalloteichus hymeniacidonis]
MESSALADWTWPPRDTAVASGSRCRPIGREVRYSDGSTLLRLPRRDTRCSSCLAGVHRWRQESVENTRSAVLLRFDCACEDCVKCSDGMLLVTPHREGEGRHRARRGVHLAS